MNQQLPPPDPSTVHPAPPARSHRGRTILAAVAGAAATVGLLGVVPNLASANNAAPPTSTAATSATTAPGSTPPDTSAGVEPITCIGTVAVTDGQHGKPVVSSDTSGDCEKLFGLPFPIDEKALAAFDKCMSGILGELPKFDPNGTVTVDGSDGPSIYQFGDGDGTITITKSGDTISASSTGAVTKTDLNKIDEVFGEHADEAEACNVLLPDVTGIHINIGDGSTPADAPPTTGG
jgi:hypothetical protein